MVTKPFTTASPVVKFFTLSANHVVLVRLFSNVARTGQSMWSYVTDFM